MNVLKILLLSLTGLFFVVSLLLIIFQPRHQTRDDSTVTKNDTPVSNKKVVFIEDDFGFKGEKIIIEPEQYIEIEKPVTI